MGPVKAFKVVIMSTIAPKPRLDKKEEKLITWFSSLLRWGLGVFFLTTGIIYIKEGAWPAILFGILIFVTGFFKPKRCID